MKFQSLSIDSDEELKPWEHFIKEDFTQFGGLPRMECATLGFYYIVGIQETEKWLKLRIESGRYPHRKEATVYP